MQPFTPKSFDINGRATKAYLPGTEKLHSWFSNLTILNNECGF
jgi:hypothetical protein